MKPAVFLDRDGVINKAIVKHGKPFAPRSMHEFQFTDGLFETISRLREGGFELVVVTNQPDIAKNITSESFVEEIHLEIAKTTGIQHFYVCKHIDEDNCDCRKPKPGLLLRATSDLNLDLTQSFLIGDRWRDIEAGNLAGCKTIFIDYGYREQEPLPPYIRVRSVSEASRKVLEINNGQ